MNDQQPEEHEDTFDEALQRIGDLWSMTDKEHGDFSRKFLIGLSVVAGVAAVVVGVIYIANAF